LLAFVLLEVDLLLGGLALLGAAHAEDGDEDGGFGGHDPGDRDRALDREFLPGRALGGRRGGLGLWLFLGHGDTVLSAGGKPWITTPVRDVGRPIRARGYA